LEPISPPNAAFEVPVAKSKWVPVSIGSSDGKALAKALVRSKTIAMLLPKSSTIPALEDRVFQMVKAAAPDTEVVARSRAVLDELLKEKGEIPYRRTLEPAGTDILGRPYYLPVDHPLRTEWLKNKTLLEGAKGLLVVQPIRVDVHMLRELRKGRQGGCEDFLKELEEGLHKAPAFFRVYEQDANRAISNAFARHLKVALPHWQKELARNRDVVAPGSVGERCVEAYKDLVDSYEPCLSGSCTTSPRLYLTGGGIVAMEDRALVIPKKCPVPGMWDYSAEIDELAARAVSEVLSGLNGGWVSELLRHRGLAELRRGLDRVCAPRHRRINPDELDLARTQVVSYLSELAKGTYSGEWEPAQGLERVPGVGPMKVVARITATGTNPGHEALKLIENIKNVDRCTDRRERLFEAILINVGTSEVMFMDIFFEEQLLCDDLPPFSMTE
jgi:hypothetical protein